MPVLAAAILGMTLLMPERPRATAGNTMPQAERWATGILRTTEWARLETCLPPSLTNAGQATRGIALATVAVESYLRPAWVRQAEFAYAWTLWTISGVMPDLSLGVAQMRPSTAAQLLNPNTTLPLRHGQMDIWVQLRDTCPSVRLAFAFFDQGTAPESTATRIAAYNGRRLVGGAQEDAIYTGVVLAIAQARNRSGID